MSIKEIPFYEKGKYAEAAFKWHNVDYLDFFDKIYGKFWNGGAGIGRLREVGLTRIMESENNPFVAEDPGYFDYAHTRKLNTGLWSREHENWGKILEDNGVKVHWIEYPEPPVTAFGPMQHIWAATDLLIIRGGFIIPRMGSYAPALSWGRTEWLARWAFWELGIPVVLTIVGKGVCECGASLALAEDVFCTALSPAYNQEGLDQFIPVLRRTGFKEVLVMRMGGDFYFDWDSGCSAHPDVVIGPLDIGKVIVYKAGIDTQTLKWLHDNGFEIVEINLEEHRKYLPCNLCILEPGKVAMHAGAVEAIKQVRKHGVDVIEIPYENGLKSGGGLACATMLIRRDVGPALEEVRK